MTFTRFREADDAAAGAVAELAALGHVESGVALFAEGRHDGPVNVRPVVEDEAVEWLPAFEAALAPDDSNVTGFVGSDAALAARVAAETAAWLGDRGLSVVLIDACVEDPVIAKPLADDGDEGLVDTVLFGVSPSVVIRRTLAAGVRVVTAGSHPTTKERVFESEALPVTLRAVGSDAAVFVVLPESSLDSMLDVLDVVVVVDGSPEVLSRIADRAGSGRARRIGVLAVSPGEPVGDAPHVPRRTPEPERTKPEVPAPVVLPERADDAIVHEAAAARETRAPEPEVAPERETRTPGREPAPVVALRIGRPERRRFGRTVWITVAVVAVAVTGYLYWRYAMPPGELRLADRETSATRNGDVAPDVPVVQGSDDVTEASTTAGLDETSPGDATATAPGTDPDPGAVGTGTGERPTDEPTLEVVPAEIERPAVHLDGVLSGPGGPYRLMISSHRFERDALMESAETERRGVASEVVPAEIADRGTWYRVVVSGGYPRLAAAREVLDIVKGLGYEGAWIERTQGSE